MADMDFDILDDVPKKAPTRTSRFAPRGSKLEPKPKPEPKPEPASDPVAVKAKEEPKSEHPLLNSVKETEPEVPSTSTDAVRMDVDGEGGEAKGDAMEEGEEEDVVVREIDVYYTPVIDPSTQLYVLQYPLRPCWRPYELDDRCEEVRIKPTTSDIELDISVDFDSKNYNPDTDHRLRVRKQTLASSMKPTFATGYAAGVLMGNEMYINPVHAVVQLRPSMEHLAPGGSKKKGDTSNAEGTSKSAVKDAKTSGPSKKPIKQPGIPDEPVSDALSWVSLKYHSSKSDLSDKYMRKMTVGESTPIQFSMSPYEYLSSLCPGAFSDGARQMGSSRRFLLSLPLEERYSTWFREAPSAHRFDTLMHLAPKDSINDVLEVVKKLVRLVQGHWVPKSNLIIDEKLEVSARNLEMSARDLVLALFSKNNRISYNVVSNGGTKFSNAMKVALKVLATDRPTLRDWKFKEPPDVKFMKRFPEIVEEQRTTLEKMEKAVNGKVQVGSSNSSRSTKPDIANGSGNTNMTSKGAVKSSNGVVSRTPVSNAVLEALPNAIQKVLQTYKACRYEQICQNLRGRAVTENFIGKGDSKQAVAAAIELEAPREKMLEVLSQIATNIHGVYVSKSSPDHPQYDEFRKIVIDLLIAEGANAKLKKASLIEAAKIKLDRVVSGDEYSKVMNELCVYQGSAWMLRSWDGGPI